MRLFFRNLRNVTIHARECAAGALGVSEGFAQTGTPALASVEFVNNTLNQNANALISQPYGTRAAASRRLRFARGTAISAGDGVKFAGEGGDIWRCTSAQKFFTHTVARVERAEE